MEKNKKTTIEQEVDNTISALITETKPIRNAMAGLDKEITESKGAEHLLKLPKLLHHLTKISKRKTISKKLDLNGIAIYTQDKSVTIGLNCNGLGYANWGTQINPLCKQSFYNYNDQNFKVVMAIFNDEELCLEIADEIISKNRRNFLRLASFFRKANKNDTLIETDDDEEEQQSQNGVRVDFDNNGNISKILIEGEELEWRLRTIIVNPKRKKEMIKDLGVSDLFFVEKVNSNADKVAEFIISKEMELKDTRKYHQAKDIFVAEMVEPIEALENL